MKCIHCNAELSSDAMFCTNCGKPVNRASEAPVNTPPANKPPVNKPPVPPLNPNGAARNQASWGNNEAIIPPKRNPIQTVHCVNCGKEIPAASSYCHYCWHEQSKPASFGSSGNPRYCPTCCKPIPAGMLECPDCERKKSRSKVPVIIAIAAAAVLLLVAGGGLWYFKTHSQKQDSIQMESAATIPDTIATAAVITEPETETVSYEETEPEEVSVNDEPATEAPVIIVSETEAPTAPADSAWDNPHSTFSPENHPSRIYTMSNINNLKNIDSEDWNEEYFWGQERYKRDDIESIQFLYYTPSMSSSAFSWDVSERKDGSVRAYVDAGNLYVVSDGRIGFPSKSDFLFAGFVNVRHIDFINAVDTSSAVTMERMFSGCNNLMELDLYSFNTSRVENMKHMFAKCKSLMELDVSMFDTSRVSDMESMFYGCKSLTDLNISSFKTSSVITMKQMFAYCESIPEIDVSRFDVRRVKYMTDMFRDCYKLKNVDVSGFETISLQDINSMFYSCSELEHIDITGFDMSKVYAMVSTFQRCDKLTNITAGNWNLQKKVPHKNFMNPGATINDIPWENFLESFN